MTDITEESIPRDKDDKWSSIETPEKPISRPDEMFKLVKLPDVPVYNNYQEQFVEQEDVQIAQSMFNFYQQSSDELFAMDLERQWIKKTFSKEFNEDTKIIKNGIDESKIIRLTEGVVDQEVYFIDKYKGSVLTKHSMDQLAVLFNKYKKTEKYLQENRISKKDKIIYRSDQWNKDLSDFIESTINYENFLSEVYYRKEFNLFLTLRSGMGKEYVSEDFKSIYKTNQKAKLGQKFMNFPANGISKEFLSEMYKMQQFIENGNDDFHEFGGYLDNLPFYIAGKTSEIIVNKNEVTTQLAQRMIDIWRKSYVKINKKSVINQFVYNLIEKVNSIQLRSKKNEYDVRFENEVNKQKSNVWSKLWDTTETDEKIIVERKIGKFPDYIKNGGDVPTLEVLEQVKLDAGLLLQSLFNSQSGNFTNYFVGPLIRRKSAKSQFVSNSWKKLERLGVLGAKSATNTSLVTIGVSSAVALGATWPVWAVTLSATLIGSFVTYAIFSILKKELQVSQDQEKLYNSTRFLYPKILQIKDITEKKKFMNFIHQFRPLTNQFTNNMFGQEQFLPISELNTMSDYRFSNSEVKPSEIFKNLRIGDNQGVWKTTSGTPIKHNFNKVFVLKNADLTTSQWIKSIMNPKNFIRLGLVIGTTAMAAIYGPLFFSTAAENGTWCAFSETAKAVTTDALNIVSKITGLLI